jgi:muconate cycloisomerase
MAAVRPETSQRLDGRQPTPRTLELVAIEPLVVDLPTRADLELAGGTAARRGTPSPRVLVKAIAANGMVGWGESTPSPSWSYETVETIYWTIRNHLAPVLRGLPAWDLDGLHRMMDRAIMPGFSKGQPIAKSGVDLAVHDLLARTMGVPLYELLGGRRRDTIELGWVVSSSTPSSAADVAREGLDQGYSAFKVKIGMHSVAEDVQMVAAVRQCIGANAFLWVDANQAYTSDQAVRVAAQLQTLGVDAFEQPLAANDISGLKRLIQRSLIPLALDESVRTPSDLAQFAQLGIVDVAIAKVARSGGLWPARQFGELAEACSIRLMGSGLTETDIGLSASVQLYARLGIDTPVDLNGRQFIESSFVGVNTIRVIGGTAYVPQAPGTGVDVDEERLARFVRAMPK